MHLGCWLLLFPDVLNFGGEEASSLPSATSTVVSPSSSSPDSQIPQDDPLSYFAVADVRGRNYYDIKGTKLNGDMPIEVAGKQYSDQPKGTILSQEPAPEERAKKGTTVKVILSDGPQQRTVPDVSGWPEQYAKLYLEALGYRVETIYLEASTVDKGLVQETSPLQGTTAEEGDTIILRVSNQEQTPPAVSSDGGGWFW